MTSADIAYRVATGDDMPGITRVRTGVVENHMSVAQMAERGITEDSVAASFVAQSKGWVALHLSEIVGFAIADRETRSIFALFVLPAFAGRGIGSHLLDLATDWLWGEAASRIWLTTRQGTKAASFYKQKGWKAVDLDPLGNIRYELEPPSGRTTS